MNKQKIKKFHIKSFTQESYWNKFFHHYSSFEWYEEPTLLGPVIANELGDCHTEEILHIGCGTSSLGPKLVELGYTKTTNIDFSPHAIEMMIQKYGPNQNGTWVVENITSKTIRRRYQKDSVGGIIDKGFLDSILSGADNQSQAMELIQSILDILAVTGKFFLITIGEGDLIKTLARISLQNRNLRWKFIPLPGDEKMTPFLFVIVKEVEEQEICFQSCVFDDYMMIRPKKDFTLSEFLGYMKSLAGSRIAVYLGSKFNSGNSMRFTISGPTVTHPYHIIVYDSRYNTYLHEPKTVAVMLDSLQTNDWIVDSPEGIENVAAVTKANRVLLVYPPRRESFSLSSCQDAIKDLALPNSGEVEVISVCFSDSWTKLHVTHSDINGTITVEELSIPNHQIANTFQRRMVFNNSPNILQSEMLLSREKHGVVFHQHIVSTEYHSGIIYLLIILKGTATSSLVLGLGGGALCGLLGATFPNIRMKAVEIDPVVVRIAEEYFDLKRNKCDVVVDDADVFLKESEEAFDFIVVDINGSDEDSSSEWKELRFPSLTFIQKSCLESMRNRLTPDGIVIFNVVTRCEDTKVKFREAIMEVFPTLVCLDMLWDSNSVWAGACRSEFTPPKKRVESHGISHSNPHLTKLWNTMNQRLSFFIK